MLETFMFIVAEMEGVQEGLYSKLKVEVYSYELLFWKWSGKSAAKDVDGTDNGVEKHHFSIVPWLKEKQKNGCGWRVRCKLRLEWFSTVLKVPH
ncbi:unnamed protein product [Sphenostylis stenocarpa]|uniref:Uncharacterized protein n=1 Tax=Sphenostylis stenocarpa TaxID=92480 RepID=A0AA86T2Y1_9FABA|nr:unnamed protein product [Sphenostylis stenocarpa]